MKTAVNQKSALLMVLFLLALAGCSAGDVSEDGSDELSEDVPALEAGTDELPSSDSLDEGEKELSEASLDSDTSLDEPATTTSTETAGLSEAPPADAPPVSEPATDTAIAAVAPSEPVPTENQNVVQVDPVTPEPAFSNSGPTDSYTFKKGDTLMRVSFETTGDLFRWREIYEMNKDKIADVNHVPPGTVIQVPSGSAPSITKNGTPYLIRKGDTLGRISNKVYGTTEKWRKIWKNNPELIKDPNRIYAGFYLYYAAPDASDPIESTPQPLAEETVAPTDMREPASAAPTAQAPVQPMDQAVPADMMNAPDQAQPQSTQ